MRSCSIHETNSSGQVDILVIYDRGRCPLCEALMWISELKEKVEELENREEELS